MSYKLLPKIELHIHLDCSLSYNVVKKLRPETTIQDYNQNFKAGESCSSLKHYIKCADNAISLMQTKESLELVMEDFFDQLINDLSLIHISEPTRRTPISYARDGLLSRMPSSA